MGALDDAARLGVVGDAVCHGEAEPAFHVDAGLAHQRVFIAGTVVYIEQGRDAAGFASMAQGVQDRETAFGRVHAPADDAAGCGISHRGDFRTKRFAVLWMRNLGSKGVTVGCVDIGRPEHRAVAANEGLDAFDFTCAHAAGLQLDVADFLQAVALLTAQGQSARLL